MPRAALTVSLRQLYLSGIQLSAGLEKHIINTALLINNKVMDIRAHLDGSLKPHNAAATLKLDIDRMDWQGVALDK